MTEKMTTSWCRKGTPGFEEGYRRALKLRIEVFVTEQGFVNEADETDATAHHLLLERGGHLVATARLFPAEESGAWHVGRVAVKKDERKGGMGARVMLACEEKARALGGSCIVLSAQQRVQPFYEKCGYTAEGEAYYDEYCLHIDMRKSL